MTGDIVGGSKKRPAFKTMSINPVEMNSHEIAVPSQAKVERSQRVINAMIASGQLSIEGEAWLKVASDPWHDTKIKNFVGIPNKQSGQVVTMSVVQEVTIKKPVALAAGNWSVRVTTNPIASAVDTVVYQYKGNVGVKLPEVQNALTMYPVQIDYSPDNVDFLGTGNSLSHGLEIPEQFLKGPYQVAGMGLEVINTTASLQKQGLATCAVMNQQTQQTFGMNLFYSSTAGTAPVNCTTYAVKTPPANLAEMLLLPGTTQWEAQEGAYSVVQLQGLDENPPTGVPEVPLFIGSDFDAHTQVGIFTKSGAGVNMTTFNEGAYTSRYCIEKTPGHVPMNSTIHIYSGLSDQTTLTLRARWILVRRPNDNEPEILVLTHPDAEWDPAAIQIWSHLMNQLPPAVMFKENPKGEWWKSMLAGIADIAGSGLMMMPHPLAKGAGAAIMAGRAFLAPDIPVQVKAARTKNAVVPAKRKPQNPKGVKFISPEQLAKNKKNKKKKVKRAQA